MSEWADWVEILWGFTKFNFKQMLKVSAFYLEKQKSFIPLSRTAKLGLKDGVSRPNFQWRFWLELQFFYRWRLLLSVSLVNGFFIVSGFLLNFKEISRMFFECCEFKEPYNSINTNTYEIWSFVLLIAEPFLRPLTWLLFYFYYLMNDPSMD